MLDKEHLVVLIQYHKQLLRVKYMSKESYREYLKSDDWQAKRELKRSKHQWRCGICGATDRIDIHHLNYRNLTDVEMSDLRKMCHRCHILTHELHKAGKIIFKSTSHQSRWTIIKDAVKKELGIYNKNMFRATEESTRAKKKRDARNKLTAQELFPTTTVTVLSKEEIELKRTAKGGYLRKDLESWGIEWPPPKGWQEKLLKTAPKK